MTIWYEAVSLEALNAARDGLMRHLDIVFTAVGADFIAATLPVDERTRQPAGLLHGGASVALAETIGSTGATLCIDPARFYCVGQEINANHVRAARSGRVTGTARPVHLGGRSHVWAIDIVDAGGVRVCISRLTMAIVRKTTPGSRD